MANFKFVINDPETRKSYQVEVEQGKGLGIIGKKIGDEINLDFLGLVGYKGKITGGTDKDGFPMHPAVSGPGRKRILLSKPPCFHPKLKGQRKRKMVRGNTISEDIVQINCKIIQKGVKPIEELIPIKKKEEAKEEKAKEKKSEEPKEKKEEIKKEKGEGKQEDVKEEKLKEEKVEEKEVEEKTREGKVEEERPQEVTKEEAKEEQREEKVEEKKEGKIEEQKEKVEEGGESKG
jgi:small subunit ribosomal protein S6e